MTTIPSNPRTHRQKPVQICLFYLAMPALCLLLSLPKSALGDSASASVPPLNTTSSDTPAQSLRKDTRAIASAYKKRAEDYDHQGKTKEALRDMGEAIKVDPTFQKAYLERAAIYEQQKKYGQALKDLNKAITLAPLDEQPVLLRSLIEISEQHHASAAIKDATQAIALAPSDYYAYLLRGVAYLSQEKYALAAKDISQVIILRPQTAFAYEMRSVAYAGEKDYADAIADCTQAIRLDPKSASEYQLRGAIYAAAGDKARSSADEAQSKNLTAGTEDASVPSRAITDSKAQVFVINCLAYAIKLLGAPAVPVHQVNLRQILPQPSEPLAPTVCVMTDARTGSFTIYLDDAPAAYGFDGQLAYSIAHLLNNHLFDAYVQGLNSVFAEKFLEKEGVDWTGWDKYYRDGNEPFFGTTYFMMRDIWAEVGDGGMRNFLSYAVYTDNNKLKMHININGWIASLPSAEGSAVKDIIKRYALQITRAMGTDTSYTFDLPN